MKKLNQLRKGDNMPKKANPKKRMKETLSDAFIRSDIWNAQENIFFWAIKEGFNRTPDLKNNYRIIYSASKKYKCVRNCEIHPGDKYFAATSSPSSHAKMKLCINCMAMILYFLKVWDLPVYEYDYWDDEKHRPHSDENSSHNKAMQDIVEKALTP